MEVRYIGYFSGVDKEVIVSEVSGGGQMMFHVMVDNYYVCQIFKTQLYGWRWSYPPKEDMQTGDLDVLVEIVEGMIERTR